MDILCNQPVFRDVDILKSGCGYTRLDCGYTQKDVDILCYQVVFKDVDIL